VKNKIKTRKRSLRSEKETKKQRKGGVPQKRLAPGGIGRGMWGFWGGNEAENKRKIRYGDSCCE